MEEREERQPLLQPPDRRDNETNGIRKSNIVAFDEQDDPEDPLQWSQRYKWFSVALLCAFAAVVYHNIPTRPLWHPD